MSYEVKIQMLGCFVVVLIVIYIAISIKDGFADWDGNKNQKE